MTPANVQYAAARYALDLASSADLWQFADALLTQGIYTYSLGELFGLRYPCLADAAPLFVSAVEELGIMLPSEAEAARMLVKHFLFRIVEGGHRPREALPKFVSDFYPHFGFGKPADLILNACGGRELLSWDATYEYMPSQVESGYLDPAEAESQLQVTDREVLAFARTWLRERCGVPFHTDWRTGNVIALAQAIDGERAFDRLPILADAMEDAGCTNVEVLNHCRQPSVHVRGCWVVDLVLAKE